MANSADLIDGTKRICVNLHEFKFLISMIYIFGAVCELLLYYRDGVIIIVIFVWVSLSHQTNLIVGRMVRN